MNIATRLFLLTALCCGLACAQSDYPNRAARIIYPYPPGSNGDTITRIFAKAFTDALGQQFMVENRPGGATNNGADLGARPAPDGYTLFVTQKASHGINSSLFAKLPYDPLKDFAQIGLMARTPNYLVTAPTLPVNSVRELVAYARANPGKLSFASVGNGSPHHLAGALFKSRANIDVVHVPYKGAAQATMALMAGEVHFMFDSTAINAAKEGKLKVLAVADSKRLASEPQIPSMAEAGFADVEVWGYFGLAVAAKTPEAVLDKLSAVMLDLSRREEHRKRLADMGMVASVATRAETTAFITGEIEKLGPVVKAAGARLE